MQSAGQLVDQAEAALRALDDLPLAGEHPQTVLDLTARLFTLADRLDAVIQGAIEQIQGCGASWDAANLGPRRWMIEHCRRSPGEAQVRATVAERIIEHPDSRAAHAQGRVNLTHLKIITSTLTNLPETDRQMAEDILLRAAEHVDPHTLARLARELEATVAPDREAERAKRRYASRYLTVATTFAGMVHLDGLLDPETGAALQAALTSLTAPQGEDDPRSAGQRRADALGALARHALASEQLPEVNGSKPLIQITIDWDTLHTGIGTGRIGSPGHDLPIDVETVRRLACDANILPVILGGPSGVLDIGRVSKTWPLAIRRAAALRDQGCTFPGCQAPIAFCELHHIQHWIDLGPTSLFNATHLCVRHHQIVHNKGWTVTRHPDGTLTFTDPTDHTTSTWQPPATLADFIPAADNPASRSGQPTPAHRQPASTRPEGSGPDLACQTANRHTTTMRIRTRLDDENINAGNEDPAPRPQTSSQQARFVVLAGIAAVLGIDATTARILQVCHQALGVTPTACRWFTFADLPGNHPRRSGRRGSNSRVRQAARPPP